MKKNITHRVLLIEDEDVIRNTIKLNLKEEKLIVEDYKSVDDFLEQRPDYLTNFNYDLCLIDVMLPGKKNGLEFAKEIKEFSNIPVILVTARGRLEHKLEAFEYGIDDYITKPFELEELIARVKVKLRIKAPGLIKIGECYVDLQKGEVHKKNKKIQLTDKELGILLILYQNKNHPVDRNQILDKLWMDKYPTNRTIDNFILRLRKIFEKDPSHPEYILTYFKKGYMLSLKERITERRNNL